MPEQFLSLPSCLLVSLVSLWVLAGPSHAEIRDQPNGLPGARQPRPGAPLSLSRVPQGASSAQRGTRTLNATRPLSGTSRAAGPVNFAAAVVYGSGGFNTASVAVADLNGDGKLDLVVANGYVTLSGGYCFPADGAVGVLLGNGDGTFQTVRTYDSGGYLALSVAVGDVNGDGKPDLVVANQCVSASNCNNGTVGVLLGNGDGTFQAPVSYDSGGAAAESVTVADVNGDGKSDLLVANICPSLNCESTTAGVVGVLLGNGDGTFQSVVTYSSGGLYAISLAVADVNGDGKPDIVVANFDGNNVSVLLGNGDGTFQKALTYGPGGYLALSVAVGDVNRDGKADLVVANQCVSARTVTTALSVCCWATATARSRRR